MVKENAAQYRYWGTELRIVFILIALVFFLLAIFGFLANPTGGSIYLVITIIVVVLIRLDYNHHLISLDQENIAFKRISWGQIKTETVSLNWNEVKKITTQRIGFFESWKKTRIISREGQTISAFSFMEDYFHFLNDIVRSSKNAEIDKLTQDLIAGRADL